MIISTLERILIMKRILSVLLSLTLLPIFCINAFADFDAMEESVTIYEDNTPLYTIEQDEELFLSETDESAMEVVSISSVNDLINLRNNINSDSDYSKDKIFKLTNNIDLGGIEWEPIGYNDNYHIGDNLIALRDYSFRGIFDGQGHTISNFKMTNEKFNYLGFFGTIHLGTVKNLNIADAYIDYNGTSTSEILQFSGLLSAFSNHATISDCNISGNITIKNDDAYVAATTTCTGLITGSGIAQISDCNVSGNIDVNTLVPPYAGGLWGFASTALTDFDSHIENCTSATKITLTSISGINAGGIIGFGSESIENISDCKVNEGSDITVNHTYSDANLASAPVFAGGICGVNFSDLNNCSVDEIEINANAQSSPTIGGIAGKNEAVIDTCSTLADLSVNLTKSSLKAAASATAGGIAGMNGGNYNKSSNPAPADYLPVIKNCNVKPEVEINITSDSTDSVLSGFISGIAYAPSEIVNCSSASCEMSISSTSGAYIGGICGLLNGAAAKYCSAYGNIGENISVSSALYIGGIAGDANLKYFYTYDPSFNHISPLFTKAYFYGAVIEDCISKADITAKNATRLYAGGVCGYMTNNYVEDSKNYYITANRELGISRCAAKGKLSVSPQASNYTYAGGCIGYAIDGKIYNSYSSGDINVTADKSSTYIGGFIGVIYQNRHDYAEVTASVDNCYTTSEITLPESASALTVNEFCGLTVKSPVTEIYPKLTGCYYYGAPKADETEGLTALDSASLVNTQAYTGWDFNNIWYMTEQGPVLSYEQTHITDFTRNDDSVSSLTISTSVKNFYVYAVTYSGDTITDTRIYSSGQATKDSAFIYNIPCDITVSADTNTKIYIWSSLQEPLCDVYEI